MDLRSNDDHLASAESEPVESTLQSSQIAPSCAKDRLSDENVADDETVLRWRSPPSTPKRSESFATPQYQGAVSSSVSTSPSAQIALNCTEDRPDNANIVDDETVRPWRSPPSATNHSESFATLPNRSSISPPNTPLEIIEEDTTPKPSILKKKFDQRSSSLDTPKPNSILKRKTFEETHCNSAPSYGPGRQGILKKYSSWDEGDDRKRSCSPDVDLARLQEFKPILKQHRRSSLEEETHSRSPELHSILKRSKPSQEDSSDSGTNPQGILKRKSSNVNGFSSVAYDRTSAEEALADCDSTVKPILKNKQSSWEATIAEKGTTEAPRPILKKKQSSESEFDEEKPKKPILKISRKSLDEEMANFSIREPSSDPGSRSIKPILKKKHVNYMDKRSVKSDDDTGTGRHENQNRVKRHSLPGRCFLPHIC